MQKVLRLPPGAEIPTEVVHDLVYGWGNEGWCASPEYIRAFVQHAWQISGPILECGSGLSTILLAIVAQRTGNRVFSLEHDLLWAGRVKATLTHYDISSCEVCVAELKSFGWYSWYAVREDRLPSQFAFVVCDGPPGGTPGGRYGLLPEMGTRLKPGCVILLDDTQRVEERAILKRWAHELGSERTRIRFSNSFAWVTVPEAPPPA